MVCKNIWPYLVLHPVLNIMGFCPYFVPSPGMPWQESVLLDRCEERNRGGGHHLRFCEHSHQDTRCRGCRWCRWCQAGRFRRTWNCEIGYIDITSQPELSRPYISLQWCNDARMVLTVEEWAWRMFRSLRPQCRKGWKTVRSQEAIICIYGFLYVCIHYTLDTFQFQVCFSIGRILECFGWLIHVNPQSCLWHPNFLDIFQVHYWDPLYSQIRESFEFTPAPAIVKDGWKPRVFHTWTLLRRCLAQPPC